MNDSVVLGFKKSADKILGHLMLAIEKLSVNDYESSKRAADKATYDAHILKDFFSANDVPEWLLETIKITQEHSANSGNASQIRNRVAAMVALVGKIQYFDWSVYYENGESLDLDEEFRNCESKSKLNEALDNLINSLGVFLREAEPHLNRETIVNFETVMAGLKRAENSSQSAITSWLSAAKNLIEQTVPGISQYKAVAELLGASYQVLDDATIKLIECTNAVQQKAGKWFCGERDLFVALSCEEKKSIDLEK